MAPKSVLRIAFLFFPVLLTPVVPGESYLVFALVSGVAATFLDGFRQQTKCLPYPVFLILFYAVQMSYYLMASHWISFGSAQGHGAPYQPYGAATGTQQSSGGNLRAGKGQIKTMSIIMAAYNEHKYMKRTLESIYERTPSSILVEIIVVDDASDPPLAGEMTDFPDVKIVRHETRKGLIKSKTEGGNVAIGDLLMFLDAHVKPEWGWVDPLLRHANTNYKRVVVPLIPILDGETWVTNNNAVGVKMMFDWTLFFQWFEDYNDLVPCMSGGLFAITKTWWHESGEYDYDMKMWGAENIEQSIRIWLCGGEIYVARDSRVAHVFRPKFPYPINNTEIYMNKVRTIEVWFDDFKDYYYKADPVARQFIPWIGDISSRLLLKKNLQCKPFKWYVEKFRHVFLDKHMLPEETFLIRSTASGNCLQNTPNNENVEEVPCDTSALKQRWTHANSGEALRSSGAQKCIDANAGQPHKEGMKLFMYECMTQNQQQKWQLSHGQIHWASYCAVTKEGHGRRSLLEVQKCDNRAFAGKVGVWEKFGARVDNPKPWIK